MTPSQKLYAIHDPATGHTKIGRSGDPAKRLRQIEFTEGRKNLSILLVQEVAAPAEGEQELHRRLAQYRVMGEWFDLTSEQTERLELMFDEMQTLEPMNGTPFVPLATAKWKLADFMEANNVKPNDVELALGSYTRIPMVYRLANKEKPPKRVDLDTLGELVRLLRTLTGKPVTFDDLLEHQDD